MDMNTDDMQTAMAKYLEQARKETKKQCDLDMRDEDLVKAPNEWVEAMSAMGMDYAFDKFIKETADGILEEDNKNSSLSEIWGNSLTAKTGVVNEYQQALLDVKSETKTMHKALESKVNAREKMKKVLDDASVVSRLRADIATLDARQKELRQSEVKNPYRPSASRSGDGVVASPKKTNVTGAYAKLQMDMAGFQTPGAEVVATETVQQINIKTSLFIDTIVTMMGNFCVPRVFAMAGVKTACPHGQNPLTCTIISGGLCNVNNKNAIRELVYMMYEKKLGSKQLNKIRGAYLLKELDELEEDMNDTGRSKEKDSGSDSKD